MTDNNFVPKVPQSELDCLYETIRKTLAGLEYALLEPAKAREVVASLHDDLVRAYVEHDGGQAMLDATYNNLSPYPFQLELTYLASPFSATGTYAHQVEKERFEQVSVVAAELFRRGKHVFCPIAHSHSIKDIGGHLPGSFSFWAAFDTRMLALCDTVTVCQLSGWEQSVGVTAEIELAKSFCKTIHYLDPVPILTKWKEDHGLTSEPWPHTMGSKFLLNKAAETIEKIMAANQNHPPTGGGN
jgi:hypothetical protein